jgi:hypothetical protein
LNPVLQAMPRAFAARTNAVRNSLQLGAGLGALTLVAFAQPAFAANECGPAAAGTVTCTAAATPPANGNPYPNGVSYNAPPGPLTVVLNADTVVDTTPSGNVGVNVQSPNQNLTVNAAPGATVKTIANGADAIRAESFFGTGNIAVSGGNLSTFGDQAYGVRADTFTGSVLVNGGTVSTNGSNAFGIYASTAIGSTATVTGGDVTTQGDGAIGVYVSGGSGLTAAAPMSVKTSGIGATGIYVTSSLFSGTAQAGSGTTNVTTSGSDATGISAFGRDGTTVNYNNITTTGLNNAVGISVVTGSAVTNINGSTTGLLSTTGTNSTGINATALGATTIKVGNVSATGVGSSGINATAGTNVSVTAGNVTSGNNGVTATTLGAGNATVAVGNVTTTDAGAYGVQAQGNVVNLTAGNVVANGNAVLAGATGTNTVKVGNVTSTGAGNIGVLATGTAVDVTSGNVNAQGTGLIAVGSNGVTVRAGQVTSTSTTGGNGIIAATSGGDVNVQATGVTGNGDALIAAAAGGTVVNVGNVTSTGATGRGIFASAGTSVNVTSGNVTSGGDGIQALGSNAVTVNAGRVNATGAGSRGIVATSSTAGPVSVTSTGVTANGDAVVATGTGTVAANLSGTNNSVTGSGAVLNAGTTATLTLANGGTLNGAVNGATITAPTSATVTNFGTIGGTNAAIDATGVVGPTAITNNASGTINGRILLGAGNDTLNNAGVFNSTAASTFGAGNDTVNNSGTFNANANNDFGAGNDTFNNSGTFRVLPTSAVAGTVTLAGLEAFNNSGSITLLNGHTGDNLVIPGTYTGTGAAALAVDVNLGTTPTTSDRLTIGGAATGSTAVTVNRLDTGPAVLSTAAGTTVVQAGAGSTTGAFTLAGGPDASGIIQYGIVFNPTLNQYNLVSAPGAAAYRTSLFGDGVRNLWLQSADAWSGHMRELRDNIAANGPGGAGGRFWIQGFGQKESRSNSATYGFNGIVTPVNLSYDQDYYGVQMGLDFGAPVGDAGGFNFGITGGYQNSKMSFGGNTADHINFNAINGGVYGSFTSGIFFVNALGKYDYYWGENISPSGNYRNDVNGSVWGGKAEAGLRFGQDLFIEPSASIAYTHSDFGDLGVAAGNFAINDDDGLRGKAGGRVGYVTQVGGAKLTVYAGANYVHEFQGRSNVTFTSGGQSVAFRSPYNNDYVEGTFGVNIGSDAGKISGFFEGRYSDGSDYNGYGARGGVRVRF